MWDADVGTGSLIAEYYYDPFGRRLWKDVGGVRTYFHYADEGLVGEYDATGAEIKTYGYKPGSTWTTDPLFIKQNNQYYFYHNDHLGTPQKITAMNGAVVWSAKYSSFGEANVDVETITNNLRFPGQYYDEESGLSYNYHRYYDAETGRYLEKDPIGPKCVINLYAYVNDNPINLIDPKGLSPEYIPPEILALPDCNAFEKKQCAIRCGSINQRVKICKRDDRGSGGVFINCICDNLTEEITQPERPQKMKPRTFDLDTCLAEANIRYKCQPVLRTMFKIACYLAAAFHIDDDLDI